MRRLTHAVAVLCITVPLFATQANPSARQKELSERLLTAMNIQHTLRDTIDAMFAQLQKQLLATADPTDEESTEEAQATFKSFRERAAKIDFAGALHDSYVELYSKYFNEKELEDLVAFFDTPAGKKMIEVTPQLTADAMRLGEQHLGPLIMQAMREAIDDQEQKRPWRKTMSDMRSIATAVEAYAIDHDDEYPAGDYDSLKKLLEPDYIKTLPAHDMWGHGYAYAASDDHHHYRVVSAGADTIFEWDSRTITASKNANQPAVVYRERLEDDLIYADGAFIQAPVQAKPKVPNEK